MTSNWTVTARLTACALVVWAFIPITLWAQAPPHMPLTQDASFAPDYNQALLSRLQETEARLQQLEQHMAAQEASTPVMYSAGEQPYDGWEKSAAADDGPSFPTVRVSGFMHLDAGYFAQDANNILTLGDIEDGVGFRRARLQAMGSVSEFTNYAIEFDFATAGRPSFMDVWGEQTHIPILGNVRIGHFRQPTNMESWTSIRQITFLERSLPFQAFDPFRRVGIMAYDKSENEMWSWAYGIYRTGGFAGAPVGDTRFATDIGDEGGISFVNRLTHLLYFDEPTEGRYLLHVGGHFNYSRITGSAAVPAFYQARAIPEFFVGDPAGGGATSAGTPFFVDTGRLPADQFIYYGLQLAAQYGPANFQAEYMGTSVDQNGAPSVYYDGAYAQVGFFLTGENRSYNRMNGVFDGVVPFTDFFSLGRQGGFCGWGAWELTGRWSFVNLNDPNAVPVGFAAGPPVSPNPGRMHDTTLGLNWYWNRHSKVQLNWIHCFLDNAIQGDSDCDIYAARFQIEF